jgi:hypothetical protein
VSDSRSLPETLSAGFREVVFIPIADCVPIDPDTLAETLATLDRLFLAPQPRVLVHCLAGQNRSPTIIWLFLRSLGVNSTVAKELIEAASMDAVGGHPLLWDNHTIAAMVSHRLSRATTTLQHLRNVVLGDQPPSLQVVDE